MEGLVKVDKVFVLHGLVMLHADYECRDWLRGLQHRKWVQVLGARKLDRCRCPSRVTRTHLHSLYYNLGGLIHRPLPVPWWHCCGWLPRLLIYPRGRSVTLQIKLNRTLDTTKIVFTSPLPPPKTAQTLHPTSERLTAAPTKLYHILTVLVT